MKYLILLSWLLALSQTSHAVMSDCQNATDLQINPHIRMNFCEVPAATGVLIGSENEEPDESPIVARNFNAFAMAQVEVTQSMYKVIMDATPWESHLGENGIGDDKPAVGMLYRDALEFARRIDQLDPTATYRLPTEAEWEYAARGLLHQTARYHWGDVFDSDMAFYGGNSGDHPQDVNTCPNADRPAGYCANDLGIFHMSGNVWEWTIDKYQRGHEVEPVNGHFAIIAEAIDDVVVVKGSSYDDSSDRLRTANRFSFWDGASHNVGFRLVRIPNGSKK